MTDFQVTNGIVRYEHKRPGPADYEGKTPMVELHYAVAEGADPVATAAKVMAIAVQTVNGVLGLAVAVPAEPAREPAKRGRLVKETTSEPTPEMTIVDEPDAATVTDDDIGLPAPKEISLEDMQHEAMRVSAALTAKFGNINKLKALIKACAENKDGARLQDIAKQPFRKLFMDQVKGLVESE